MLEAPRLPLAVRAFNVVAGPLAGRLPPFSLRSDALLHAARKRTGLSDFGDPWFTEGLEILTRALEEEAALSPLGRLGTGCRDPRTGVFGSSGLIVHRTVSERKIHGG